MNKKFLYFSANYVNKLCLFLSTLAILLGGLIYILFRPSKPIFFHWISTAGMDSWLNFVRHGSLSLSKTLPEWVVFSLPNGLWAFAYAILITSIWSKSDSWLKYFWMGSIPILVLGFETFQYAGILPGTFCLQDIAFGCIGLISGILLGIRITKPNNYENKSN